ncbi:MAG: hypothetical protein IJ767_01085 [Bacteroidaceae bacterium]|nr:hypothetical protein [Bacteroidaceae bacterium]
MNKKTYQQPALSIVSVEAHGHILDGSLRSIGGNADMKYGGGSSTEAARVKGQGDYNVWDDDWNK